MPEFRGRLEVSYKVQSELKHFVVSSATMKLLGVLFVRFENPM